MEKKLVKTSAFLVSFLLSFGGGTISSCTDASVSKRKEIEAKYAARTPVEWGEHINGVVDKVNTSEKTIALTFDLCRGGYDEKLINFLIENQVPANIFMTGKWREENPTYAKYLAEQSVFKIENHGYSHKPLCINGQKAYGIEGTKTAGEVYDEVEKNADIIQTLTGRRPLFFRSGTAFYDDVALAILKEINICAIGYTIAGDEGATLSKEQILKKCANPPNGAILLFHMNHPECDTGEAVQVLVLDFLQKGFRFVFLEDVI